VPRDSQMDPVDACREKALDLLGRKPHSAGDLRAKLRKRQFPANTVDAVLSDLERLGLLDDEALARSHCEFRLHGPQAVGRRKVAAELARHGILKEIADRVLAEVWDDDGREGEFQRGVDAGARKLRQLSHVEDRRAAWGKLARFLAGQGFTSDICRAAASRLLDEQDCGQDEF